jgi:hypothetical protein
MALKIYDTIEPQGPYPAVNAEHVSYQGKSLVDFIPVVMTQAEYNALVEADAVNPDTIYFIELEANGDE